jgi:iron complex outermembrane receptor protein
VPPSTALVRARDGRDTDVAFLDGGGRIGEECGLRRSEEGIVLPGDVADAAPLAQMPPLEARLGLEFSRAAWSAGALLRAVAEQDRYVVNQGNIVGQDLGPTAGFTVLSLNGGWRPRTGVLLTAGVDNLFDRAYAEHLSRGGAMVSGYVQTTQVNEPGRTLWFKLNVAY